jgi:hypothetical protein
MKSKYRIVIETEVGGKQHFYVQEKIFGFIWVYSITTGRKVFEADSLGIAEGAILRAMQKDRDKRNSKIAKKEIVYPDLNDLL